MKLTSLFCCSPHSAAITYDDYPIHASQPHVINGSSTSVGSSTKPQKAAKSTKSASISEPEPYSSVSADALFAQYADDDDPNVIGPEKLEKLCGDASIALEGALTLILAWQFGATEMAKLTKGEWEKGTGVLQ